MKDFSMSLEQILETYRKFKITYNIKDDEIILLIIELPKNSQFLPVKYETLITLENDGMNLVLPPIYKWNIKTKTNLYDVLEKNNIKGMKKNTGNLKQDLIDDIRYMNKYPDIEVLNFKLINKII